MRAASKLDTGCGVSLELEPAQPVIHDRLGDGVVLTVTDGFARVFFRDGGEQIVPVHSLLPQQSWEERVIAGLRPATPERLQRLWLLLDAHDLPLQESAASLTAAKVDLLPHQLVLTHRVATSSPRRFLIADDVGLGKTIETALILRELASRGELQRALIIVPAGLVENWRRELNDVFRLDFEVFGSSGDVTDRKTNAFTRHHRLIASIDTLKRSKRMERIAEAPRWDLVVFDEAHHLTATRSGQRVKKTDNFRLAELLRGHCRDLLLLSATPHQGDHFRFLSLIRLLNPTLYRDSEDMLNNRHRLNSVVIRRTKADACQADGSPLFARRQVHTQLFSMTDDERAFYEALSDYLRDGYNLAASQSGKARAVGFVMTVFQKIAASSFAAVRRTLERRLLSLTLHEAIVRDAAMDVACRDTLLYEARQMLIAMHGLDDSLFSRAEADRLLADARMQVMKKLRVEAEDDVESEQMADRWEDAATRLVDFALPQERQRIRELLDLIPDETETKTLELLRAMQELWHENPDEKIIVFTTYLGSVESLKNAIDDRFPNAGVGILKGGDQGAKLAAERRFRRQNGPRVLICTAAGREGINLQIARILFNHDLPWNPMDLEQRIGRIHRYGQNDTAQVYNLVAADTIEGKVFMLLEEKIQGVAAALGKVDQTGQIAEDLHSQILGQLGERLSFTRLYQEALSDPTLQRTSQELEVALSNASLAREVVSRLFQDLETFRLEQYSQVDNQQALDRLAHFARAAATADGAHVEQLSATRFDVTYQDRTSLRLTIDREEAMADESLQLLGLEHPLVSNAIANINLLPPEDRALVISGTEDRITTVWQIQINNPDCGFSKQLLTVSKDSTAAIACFPYSAERFGRELCEVDSVTNVIHDTDRKHFLHTVVPKILRSHLEQMGYLQEGSTYAAQLLAWIETGYRSSNLGC